VVLVVPLTVVEKLCVWPAERATTAGVMETATVWEGDVVLAELEAVSRMESKYTGGMESVPSNRRVTPSMLALSAWSTDNGTRQRVQAFAGILPAAQYDPTEM